ncbi:MAG: alpha-amylase, partial [Nocardioidaceae bacterium]|nr:alpha-amylase [Nocardioidaceae bacterium]
VVPSVSADAGPPSARQGRGPTTHDVVANLWEWNWPSVARECTDVLGPSGYGAVQVAPPQDSLKRTDPGSEGILHPWWEVYQAVDYQLTSRMGDERQFRDMVSTCRAAGMKVYVDAVINHTTGQGSTSYGGKSYEHFSYPAVPYGYDDFHHRGAECDSASGGIEDFNNQRQVFRCELLGLADLKTEQASTQRTIAAYLNKLLGYGVSGFRVDAAKHVGQDDLDAIYARLHDTREGNRPFWALEVFGGGPGTLSPQAFVRSGTVLGLDGVKQLRDAFKSYPAEHVGSIATLETFGEGSGLTPSRRTLSFVQNHDTERNGDALSYKDGATNRLATQYLLASGYGRPQVYAAFTFGSDTNQSPPSTPDGMITDTDCGSDQWSCTDRDPGVNALVRWHDAVGRAPQADWWDDGGNVISFRRGPGWVAFNNNAEPRRVTLDTGLPRGHYCDEVTRANGCTPVDVDSHGRTTVTVPAKGAVAVLR